MILCGVVFKRNRRSVLPGCLSEMIRIALIDAAVPLIPLDEEIDPIKSSILADLLNGFVALVGDGLGIK